LKWQLIRLEQEHRKEALAKNSLASIIQEANNFSNEIMQMAVKEGALPEFESLPAASYDDWEN
jgi:hypothetical protein